MSLNVSEQILSTYKSKCKNDIDLLKDFLGNKFDAFFTYREDHYAIRPGCICLVFDSSKRQASSLYLSYFAPILHKPVISISITDHNSYYNDIEAEIYDDERDVTITISGQATFIYQKNHKIFFLIDRIHNIDFSNQ